MTLKYKYQIVRVDEANKTMEIRFTSEGKRTHHVAARLPFKGESLDTLVHKYAPVSRWSQEDRTIVTPRVGFTGSFDPLEQTETVEQKTAKIKAERQRRMSLIADPIFFKWQRGEATEQQWLDAVESVRASLPYPEQE